MDVYLDSAEENIVPALALEADHLLDGRRDGYLRPLASADAFGRFLDAWRVNDPNGDWGYATEVGEDLICTRPGEDEPSDAFPLAGRTSTGGALYDLTGWAWVDAQPNQQHD